MPARALSVTSPISARPPAWRSSGCAQVQTLVIETNHDEKLLQNDPHRPWPVKQRIQSRHGHLSNAAAAAVIAQLLPGKIARVVLGHLSRDCNSPELAAGTVRARIGKMRSARHRNFLRDPGWKSVPVSPSARRAAAFFSRLSRVCFSRRLPFQPARPAPPRPLGECPSVICLSALPNCLTPNLRCRRRGG